MIIESCQPKDLRDIVKLHQAVLGYTLNAKIGDWFLIYLYDSLLKQPELNIVLVAKEGDKIIGFISATTDYGATNRYLMESLALKDKITIFWFILSHPNRLIEFIKQRQFSSFLLYQFTQPLCSILTLGVDQHQQGKGIGKKLINTLITVLRPHGVQRVMLDTKQNNTQAIQFYKRYGFKEQDRIFGNLIFSLDIV